MFPPEITIEDLLLVVVLAVIFSLLFANLIRQTWHSPPFCWLRFLKNERSRASCQTILVIGATNLAVLGLWRVCSIPVVNETLHNVFLTTYLLPFRGILTASLAAALLGWFGSLHLHRMLSTEEKLRVSEERFRRIFEHSATGMIIIDQNGCFVGINRAFCRMVGYEELELLGLHFTEITHPDDRDNCLREVHQLVEGKSDPMLLEKRYCRKNGGVILVSVIGTVVRDSFGHPLFLVGQVLDITEKRQTEDALSQNETKFRILVEQSLVGVYIIRDGKFIYTNPRLAEMTGYSADELLQMPSVMEVVAEIDRPLVQEQIRQRMSGETHSAHYVFRSRRKDGSQIIVEVLGTKAEYNGHPALLGTALDITQQKRAEEALRATIENTPNVSVQWYDNDGRILFWNRASEKIFGWSAAEVIGKNLGEFLLSPENYSSFRKTLSRINSGSQSEGPNEYGFTRRNGDKGFCLSTMFAIPSPDGQQRFVCMDIDITRQKAAESTLRELSSRLLNLQDEERRRIARELHDTTAQALAALTMNLALLQRSELSQTEKIQKILNESLHLAERSVQEIRTLSYLLHPPELDMVGLPSAIREYASGFSGRSGIETLVDIASNFRRLTPTQELTIFRIVQEGLGNILRHSQSTTAQIALKRANNHIHLEIRDWGQGIPPATLKAINQMHGQIGVGFAGMRERLRHLGGTLHITSSPAGTTIQATIPAQD